MYSCQLSTPIGNLYLSASDSGLKAVSFSNQNFAGAANSIIDLAINQLKEYLDHQRQTFEIPLDPDGTEFQKKVWDHLSQIPFGKTLSYQDFSVNIGDIKAIRAVASANGQNPIAIIIPCHRVIGSDGSLTGYASGLDRKEWLLQHEGAIAEQLKIF